MPNRIFKVSLRALSPGAFLFPFLAVLLVPSLAAGDEEARLRRTVETLSAPASRMTGYPGAAVAREWLVAELESLGIAEIYRHEFPVLVPIDEGFWLECAGERLELFGVWPNLVRTPTLPAEGIEGQLVYGGDGSRLEGRAQSRFTIRTLPHSIGTCMCRTRSQPRRAAPTGRCGRRVYWLRRDVGPCAC